MQVTLNWFTVLAAETAHLIPGSDWRAKIAVPLGSLIFLGSVYMLVRANLGTRRGYLVTATSLFGFSIIYALFWAFGAPGTPPATGPQNLPGQELDAYEDTWRPYAGDSLIADDPVYAVAKTYPEGFSDSLEGAGLEENFEATAKTGSDEIKTFFSTSGKGTPLQTAVVQPTWQEVERKYAVATNGRPIIGVTYQQTWQPGQLPDGEVLEEGESLPLTADAEGDGSDSCKVGSDGCNTAPAGAETGDLVEDGATYTAFAFFDKGSPRFPSYVTIAIVLVLFILHALLLAADERRERREREALAAQTATTPAERTPEPAA
jgi:hypothetical protein